MKKKFIIGIFTFLIMINLCGCGMSLKQDNNKKSNNKYKNEIKNNNKKKSEKEKKIEDRKISGKFELIEMKSSGQAYSKEDLDSLKNVGLEVIIELNENKTASLTLFGTKTDFTYDNDYFYSEGTKIKYELNNNTLKIYKDDEYLIFEKIQ